MSAVVLEPGDTWNNWGRCASARPAFVARPDDTAQVQAVVRAARSRGLTVKPVGTGHSFAPVAATSGLRVDLAALSGVRRVRGNLVTFGAGTRLHDIAPLIAPLGLALENMGDIDAQTVSGATSTGTHGTGAAFGGLATRIREVTWVGADAGVHRAALDENPELLPAVALGLGALGVIVDVTVECVPAFLLHATERPEPLDIVLDTFVERVADVDHFEFYWFPHTGTALTKTNDRRSPSTGSAPLSPLRHWFDDSFMANSVFAATTAIGVRLPRVIPSINRLSAHLTGNRELTDAAPAVFATERRVRFREMEYAVALTDVPAAVRDIRSLIEARGWRISFPIEVRAAAADDLMLSTAFGRPTGYIAVHRHYREEYDEYFRAVEAIMERYAGRPHWGKLHYRDQETLVNAYPRFEEFLAVRNRLDPDRFFANPYLDRVLGR